MAMRSWIVADPARPISQDVPAATARQLDRFWRWLAACRRRAAERRGLRLSLDEHMLHDLGPKRARQEADKPFWLE